MIPDLHFTREEVEERAGVGPWVRQRELRQEVDPKDIEETAAAYARAASEAHGAQDLAVRATEIARQAGELDAAPLVDAEGRIDATNAALQSGGDDIDAVVGHLVYAMNAALTVEENVGNLIFGPGGMEERYINHLNAAAEEWNNLPPEVKAIQDGAEWVRSQGEAVMNSFAEIPHIGWTRSQLEQVPVPSGVDLVQPQLGHLPQLRIDLFIRDKYLEMAAEDARHIYGEIDAEMKVFQRKLTEAASELSALGYNPQEGPLGLWVDPPEELPPGVKEDWWSRTANNGKGAVWQAPGAVGNADSVRIMYPTGGYPHGYVRFYNKFGQPIGLDGKPGPNSATHIPINPDGTYPTPEGW